jgi:hypothetical protein
MDVRGSGRIAAMLRTARVAVVVVLAAACGSKATPERAAPPPAAERSRGDCEDWLRHTLEIENQAAVELAKSGEPGRTGSYDEIRQRPDFLEYCRRVPDAYYACSMRAANPQEMHACEALLQRTPAADVPDDDEPDGDEPDADAP